MTTIAATLFVIVSSSGWGGVPQANEVLRFPSMKDCEAAKAIFQAEAPKAKLYCIENITRK